MAELAQRVAERSLRHIRLPKSIAEVVAHGGCAQRVRVHDVIKTATYRVVDAVEG